MTALRNRHLATLSKPLATFLFPLLAFGVSAVVFTWPLALRLQGWVPGFGDWGQNMWALWWTRHALLTSQQLPFFTQYLFYPEGVTLLFHPVDVADGLIILPLYGLVGGDVAYGLVVLVSFTLSGLGVYWLTYYLGHSRWGAWLAGLVFALSPYRALRVELGHLNLVSTQWIPFYLLFLMMYVRKGRLRYAALAVLFLVLNALCSWYYVVACALATLAVVGWRLVEPIPMGRLVLRLAVVAVISALLLSPLGLPMLQLMASTELVGEHNPLRHSVDLLSFWVPGPPSTWASAFESAWAPYAAQQREPGGSAYLGYTVVALTVGGLAVGRWRKPALWWLLVGLSFAVLSLGPQLQIAGHIYDINLPYAYLHRFIPGFSITGIPGRFVVMTALATAVLAGLAVSAGIKRLGRRAVVLMPLVSGLVAMELLTLPVAGTDTALPAFYAQMASDRDVYAVLDVKWDANYLMHAQTVHGKPLIGGWLARLPAEQAEYLNQGSIQQAVVKLLLREQPLPEDTATLGRLLREGLIRHNVRYVIDHNSGLQDMIANLVGWQPIHTESSPEPIVVYAPAEP
jgi:hypothetical protein